MAYITTDDVRDFFYKKKNERLEIRNKLLEDKKIIYEHLDDMISNGESHLILDRMDEELIELYIRTKKLKKLKNKI